MVTDFLNNSSFSGLLLTNIFFSITYPANIVVSFKSVDILVKFSIPFSSGVYPNIILYFSFIISVFSLSISSLYLVISSANVLYLAFTILIFRGHGAFMSPHLTVNVRSDDFPTIENVLPTFLLQFTHSALGNLENSTRFSRLLFFSALTIGLMYFS